MLIPSSRHRPGDVESWKKWEAHDQAWASTSRLADRVEAAEMEVARFASRGPAYCGVSWGKDSTVLADLCARLAPHVTLVWIRKMGIANPDCPAVRDAFLARHPDVRYIEHEDAERRTKALLPEIGSLLEGIGRRYLMGIRADENRGREMFRRIHRMSTERFSAPLIDWIADDVFAYLHTHDLPVHPAYAMSLGSVLDRRQLRVASVGGSRGLVHGRREWEQIYYPDMTGESN